MVRPHDCGLAVAKGGGKVSLLRRLGDQRIEQRFEVFFVSSIWVLEVLVCTAFVDQVCEISRNGGKWKGGEEGEEKQSRENGRRGIGSVKNHFWDVGFEI